MSLNYNNNLQTGNITIYPQLGQVLIGKKIIRIGPVNMKVLMILLKNQGQVVTRNQLFDNVWKNQVVSDETLTRCISDIRMQIGKASNQKHIIKTIPKMGYQWLPSVHQARDDKSNNKMNWLKWSIAWVIGLLMISTSVLWIANQWNKPNQIRLALIPLSLTQSTYQNIAYKIEETLHKKILQTKQMRFISTSVLANHKEDTIRYLFREFKTQWIVEGKIKKNDDKYHISLSLVDARTALVIYRLNKDVKPSKQNINDYCQNFVNEVEKLLN